ncbi:MAG: hypothetical protein EOM64_06555 [Erysipelotrichia bacterium]|nr:hypothetical protein [Erysipelotrichia bacterium]
MKHQKFLAALCLCLLTGCTNLNLFSAPASPSADSGFHLSAVPAYTDNPYAVINQNIPFFDSSEQKEASFETYSALDSLGRCGAAYADLTRDDMPSEKRGSIGMIKPSGWHTIRYDALIPDGKYLYNRCHLIAFQLTGQNDNPLNLITGTRYMNTAGMEPFENQAASYLRKTGNHLLYRITPVFEGNNLVCSGVLMEAKSVEDDGLEFCVYCYNVQPGIIIDYSDGSSRAE